MIFFYVSELELLGADMPTTRRPCTCSGSSRPTLDELLGRTTASAPLEVDASVVAGKRVLVTGAGGSIGGELARQVAALGPAELLLLDRDETALQQTQVAVSGHGLLDTRDVVLVDIRDAEAVRQVFIARRPDVVFHAAALKHLPMLEQYPLEGWKTNVLGTLNVLRAAEETGVERFVNISTDKAADPISVLGTTKRLAERLTADTAARTGRRYVSVRFGNVFGSRGSLLPLLESLIAAGRPVTVTHPDATRFFMSIPEACRLVLQAAAVGSPGEVLVLDMDKPVRILDVVERVIARSGRPVDIVFTGLRSGEKLHEVLSSADETSEARIHPQISHCTVPPLAADDLSTDLLVAPVTTAQLATA
jgi:FlaA1/EpsC-like NDP-sugar epimerase